MSPLIMSAAAPTFPAILLPSVNRFITLLCISVSALIRDISTGLANISLAEAHHIGCSYELTYKFVPFLLQQAGLGELLSERTMLHMTVF